mmetsp:Transcript_17546/g.27935  ORF Transcript_17546/g.27935 Transcript_17546/m.27935 type:complete len:85 (-) Transcript_17546:306-560(-)
MTTLGTSLLVRMEISSVVFPVEESQFVALSDILRKTVSAPPEAPCIIDNAAFKFRMLELEDITKACSAVKNELLAIVIGFGDTL